MPSNIEQSGNTVTDGGMLAARDVNVHAPIRPAPKLKTLAAKYRKEVEKNEQVAKKLDTLLMYDTTVDAELNLNLEEKLKVGNRQDLLVDAPRLKEHFYKLVTRHQLYLSAQEIICFLLAEIDHRFKTYVYPSIRRGDTPEEIDQKIHEKVIDPVMNLIEDDVLELDTSYLRGMVYFLTDHCYLYWKL